MGKNENKCPNGHTANIYGECSDEDCPFKTNPQQRHEGTHGR